MARARPPPGRRGSAAGRALSAWRAEPQAEAASASGPGGAPSRDCRAGPRAAGCARLFPHTQCTSGITPLQAVDVGERDAPVLGDRLERVAFVDVAEDVDVALVDLALCTGVAKFPGVTLKRGADI